MTLTAGDTLGHYRIVAPLGEGGMGAVYRATDTTLERDVALKVLPLEFAGDPDRLERFRREARALAALSHPHVVTVHSVEHAGGVHFLTMELVEGEGLDRAIPAAGYAPGELLDLAVSLADALAAAHERGIVHRDLKPANIMRDRHGRVKILDFGLAKATGPELSALAETRAPLTQAGLVVGTMPYMAPEQIEGRAIDARTDIFAFGVVLYELATGARPFSDESSARLMAAILRDDPSPIADRRPDLPGAFGRLVSRCLEKRPNDRIQTARDVFNELRALQRERPPAAPPPAAPARAAVVRRDSGSGADRSGLWLAVRPFSSRGTDDESLALGEGLTEDIAAGLARFPYLKVAATPERARYVVDGSVRRLGSTIRVSVELKDLQNGVQLWGEKFDRTVVESNLFALQDELAACIVANVGDSHGVLVLSMAAGLKDRPASDLTLDELVLRSFTFDFQMEPSENAALRHAFEEALGRDPAHAEGWACLASMYRSASIHPAFGVSDALERQIQAAQRAVALDPACQEGWSALASGHFHQHDLAAFRPAADRAIAINPLNANVVAHLSHFIAYSGDWERGLQLLDQAMALRTQHPGWYYFLPFVNHFRRSEFEDAWRTLKRVNMPESPWVLMSLAMTAARLGRWDDVRDTLAVMRRASPEYLDAEVVRRELAKMQWAAPEVLDAMVLAYREALAGETAPAPRIPPQRSSIAVLPFVNLSGDPENEYFGDGLAEDILNALTGVEGLTVIARTSAFAFKGRADDVRRIGEALGVTTVLDGSVRRAGSRVRVAAQLVDARSGAHLWSERYDREMTDIFAVQDEIAQAIARALRGTLAPGSQARRYMPGVAAYELFLKGRAQLIHFTPDAWNRARACFEEAIALDPRYAEPHAELGLGHLIYGMHGISSMLDAAPLARAAASRALELDPGNEQPRFVLGSIALAHDYDWEAGRAHFEASRRAPHVPAHARWLYASLYLHALGRFDESTADMTAAVDQDPLNATWHGIRAAHLMAAGRLDEALSAAFRARELEPNYYVSLHLVGEMLWAAGRHDEALSALQDAYRLAPWFAITAGYLAVALRWFGRDDEADQVLAAMGPSPRPMWGRAVYDLRTGALDAAADAYARMIDDRDPFALVHASSAITEPLRAHPRWPALAAMMKLPAPPV